MRIKHRKVDNYSGQAYIVEIGDLELYFSYETLVGCWVGGEKSLLANNLWSPTTGRHLSIFRQMHDSIEVSQLAVIDRVHKYLYHMYGDDRRGNGEAVTA